MPLSRLPVCSSRKLQRALERLGCYQTSQRGGTHAVYERQLKEGTVLTGIVIVGKRAIPKPTLQSILRGLQISLDDFLANM